MTNSQPYKIMVVDDSAVIRGLITRGLESAPGLQVVASVGDGQHAIDTLQRMPGIEVIVLDIEMPVMDGMTAIPELLKISPHVKIIMASTLTIRNAEVSLRALQLGAADYVPKPAGAGEAAETFKQELIGKINVLGAVARRAMERGSGQHGRPAGASTGAAHVVAPDATKPAERTAERGAAPAAASAHTPHLNLNEGPIVLRHGSVPTPDIIAIGSSTGGPQALFNVLKHLKDLPQPIVLTQHMPPSFTTILAQHISQQCGIPAAEATDGQALQAGHIYVAPGDFHMVITGAPGSAHLALNQNPPENFCRPAVDPMLRSVSALYGRKVLVAILTGMGADGARGAQTVVDAGGTVIAQDEATSVVWGMPAAVAKLGLCRAVLPLNEIGPWLRAAALGQKSKEG